MCSSNMLMRAKNVFVCVHVLMCHTFFIFYFYLFIFFQTAARGCAAGMGVVPWSRAAGAASARLDGVGLDAALSWKLTAVMEPTTTEVTFETSSIIFYLFFSSLPLSFLSLWQIVHSIPLLPLLFPLPRNLPHCSSPSSLRAVPVVLRLL